MHQLHTTARLQTGAPLALAFGAAILAGCSSDSSEPTPDITSPTASALIQNRTLDPTGETVSVTFSEAVTAATAEVVGSYTFSGGVAAVTAVLRSNGTTVDLVLDGPVLPGSNTISIAAGIEDASGNLSAEVTAEALTSSDTTAPDASSIAGTTVAGAENDMVEVIFSDDMIPSEVVNLASWTLESPLGTPFDPTGATIAYDAMTRTAMITLDAGAADKNLQTFDQIHASFTTMRDLGGNAITATAIGSSAVNAVVGGDATPPTLLAAAPDGMDVVLTFSEDVAGVETADLQSVGVPTGTEIVLTDISTASAAAEGDITVTAAPADADSITVSDGSTAVVFEFDFAAGDVVITGTPTDEDSIGISDGVLATVVFEFDASANGVTGVGAIEVDTDPDTTVTASNFAAAVNLQAFAITASANASTITLTNDATGTGGNTMMSTVNIGTAFTVTDFAGGGVAVGSIAVATDQTTPATSATNLATAIDANAFGITTSNPVGAAFDLTNDTNGVAGNVLITEVDTNGAFTINGMSGGTDVVVEGPTASTAVGTPLQGTATYSFAPVVGDTLRVYGVTDLAGNQMLPTLSQALIAANATIPALSATNSDVTAISGENNDTILVKFDAAIHPEGATDPANYTLNDGAAVDISDASFAFDGTDEVTITLGSESGVNVQAADTYDISANNVRNVQGALLSVAVTDAGIASMGDVTSPSISAAQAQLDAATANAIIITFDEAVSDTAAVDIANYTLAGNATTAAALIHPLAVRVTFTTQPVLAEMIMIAAAGQTDLAGNAAGGIATIAVTIADSTAPTVTGVTGTTGTESERDEIQITFDEPVGAAQAATIGNYVITSGSALSLTDATIWMSSVGNIVNIRLAEEVRLDTGEMISVTTSNVTDLAGNAIVAAASTNTVAGDSTAPSSAVGFINVKSDGTGATVDVLFEENMDASITTTIGNWSGSGGQSAISVTQLNSSLYRVEFDAAIAPVDTLDVLTPTDSANNEGGTITVAPVE